MTFRLRCVVFVLFTQEAIHADPPSLFRKRTAEHYCRLTAGQKVALDTEGYTLHKQPGFQTTQHLRIRLQASQSAHFNLAPNKHSRAEFEFS